MVTRKRDKKKIRKYRGSRTCGYGRVGQHRKGGQRGGRGDTGRKKHKWTHTVKYAPDYFGKKGFKRPPMYQDEDNIINLGDLKEYIPDLLNKDLAQKKGKYIELNMEDLGYDKVLAKGNIDIPLKITAKKFSKNAIKKINNAGGEAYLLNEKNE
ncbi:MAG: 50S ribosomal protein L15 [Candidatus Lokiarchaeota archaeon]|nr:50S ribosomal protein L15 [Candidatus Lokiarchaeota archaeon]